MRYLFLQWSSVGNGGESSQGYGGDLSQDLQLAGHLGAQAQQLHQMVSVKTHKF